MVSHKKVSVVNKTMMEMHIASQSSVPHEYSKKDYQGQCYLVIEEQSARFLKRYLSGEIKLDDEALEVFPLFLDMLKHSRLAEIKPLHKSAHIKMKQELILLHKKQHFKQSLLQTRFNILQKKKQAEALSSKDLLVISEMLDENLPYSTTRLKNKLRSLAMLKIENILKGKIPQDEEALQLALRFSPYRQLTALQNGIGDEKIPEGDACGKRFSLRDYLKEKFKPLSFAKQQFFTAPLFLKKAWRKTKKIALAASITALGFMGGKFIYNKGAEFLNNEEFPTKKSLTTDAFFAVSPTEKTDSASLQIEPVIEKQTINTSTSFEEKTIKEKNADSITLHKAYKNRFDSSLEILLGAAGRDKLYQEIDALAAAGKIKFAEGTTREWYAHAFTMYDKIAPYSKENKAIKNLKQGGVEDVAYINSLVLRAGYSGKGVKGTGSYSAFDCADKTIQQQHINNCQKLQQMLRQGRAR